MDNSAEGIVDFIWELVNLDLDEYKIITLVKKFCQAYYGLMKKERKEEDDT